MKPDHKGIERALIKGNKGLFFGEYHFVVEFHFSFWEETILIIGSGLNVALLNASVFEGVASEPPSMFNLPKNCRENGQKERRKYLFHG